MHARRLQGARKRRGVVLILILAMLGLLALIGVTFATFSNQSKIGADYASQAVIPLAADRFIDFALDQVLNDSSNPKSAIRGHSLLRDMYGRDFYTDPADNLTKPFVNWYLTKLPEPNGQPLIVQGAVNNTASAASNQVSRYFTVMTNIPTANNVNEIRIVPDLYGANFTGCTLRMQRWVLDASNNRYTPIRQVQGPEAIGQTFEIVGDNRSGNYHNLILSFADLNTTNGEGGNSALVQPVGPAQGNGVYVASIFEIDGRHKRAFNGTGLDGTAVNDDWTATTTRTRGYGAFPNFLYNRIYNRANTQTSFSQGGAEVALNDPNLPAVNLSQVPAQMDEDYDGADNENWFLALQSADGQVMLPSFHRPGNLVFDPTNPNQSDWESPTAAARSKFLRPRAIDNPGFGLSFPDPKPKGNKITYDVDNDGDGIPDSVWVDLGFPIQHDASGKKYKPLFAFMITGLNGRIPLNTAGNLNARSTQPQVFVNVKLTRPLTLPDSTILPVGAIVPTMTLPAGAEIKTQNPDGTLSSNPAHASHIGYSPNEINPEYVLARNSAVAPAAGQPYLQVLLQGDPTGTYEGRFGELGVTKASLLIGGTPLYPRAGRSYWPNSVTRRFDAFDTDFNGYDFFPGGNFNPENADLTDASGRVLLPVERLRRFVTPVDISGNGRVVAFNSPPSLGPYDWGTGSDAQGRVGYQLYYRPAGIPSGVTDPNDFTTNTFNKLHGYESQRNTIADNRDIMATMPTDTVADNKGLAIPSFSNSINSADGIFDPVSGTYAGAINAGKLYDGSLALNDAAQMNLFQKTAVDAPFTAAQQEWLDRFGDVDDSILDQRLANLLRDVLVTDSRASVRRHSLTAESWDLNTWSAPINSMTPDFANPSMMRNGTLINLTSRLSNGDYRQFDSVPSLPALMSGGRRFNLNMPLPTSSSPTEPIRQKYVRELYQLFKSVIAPPDGAGLSADQLAALGQFCVNVVDFRDPDATMTRFDNYDLVYKPPVYDKTKFLVVEPASVQKADITKANSDPVTQWGMEYNPIAISEILAYQFTSNDVGNKNTEFTASRLFVELVNTLTKDYGDGTAANQKASSLDLNGWGFILTQDNPQLPDGSSYPPYPTGTTTAQVERPNSATGQLDPDTIKNFFIPLNGGGMGLGATPKALVKPVPAMNKAGAGSNYYTMAASVTMSDGKTYTDPRTLNPKIESDSTGIANPGFTVDAPIPQELMKLIPLAQKPPPQTRASDYYWLHLLRPVNPRDANSEKVVVDSFRFPYFVSVPEKIDKADSDNVQIQPDKNVIYSVRRRQPYRGGHTVPYGDQFTFPSPYGFSEQTEPTSANPNNLRGNYPSKKNSMLTAQPITGPIYHSLDNPNSNNENWDYFAFQDRDFQSLAELFLVPACPPGLFTKLFVELHNPVVNTPSGASPNGDLPAATTAHTTPPQRYYPPVYRNSIVQSQEYRSNNWETSDSRVTNLRNVSDPAGFPYLSESFFYSSGAKSGWYKVLEFLEIPSNAMGYLGPVAQGDNGDWLRNDRRPGSINLNLLTEEEVLFGIIDDPRLRTLSTPTNLTPPPLPRFVTAVYPDGSPSASVSLSNQGFTSANGGGMKPAFADFLTLRDGGSGYVYSPFAQASLAFPAKPFRSLASSDINDTVLRPARLGYYGNMGTYPGWTTPRTPPRRLFQIPDKDPVNINGIATLPAEREDLGSEPDPSVNVDLTMPPFASIPSTHLPNLYDHAALNNPASSLFFNGDVATGFVNGYLGAGTVTGLSPVGDHRWHPYFRTEMMSKVMNNTTVRTHQFSMWLTVGFFEVVKEGNPQMAGVRDANGKSLGVDELGPELNAAAGKNVRYRSYFQIDRSKATGFNPTDSGNYNDLITYRRRIE